MLICPSALSKCMKCAEGRFTSRSRTELDRTAANGKLTVVDNFVPSGDMVETVAGMIFTSIVSGKVVERKPLIS